MRIWMLRSDANNYNNFIVTNEADQEILIDNNNFNGSRFSGEWRPLTVEVDEEVRRGDMQSLFGGLPVVSKNAVKELADMLEGKVEILPLNYDKEEFFILNVTNLLDCVDYEQSEVKRFSTGRIMRFIKYGFHCEKIQGEHIFKIPDERHKAPFVSDAFRERVITKGLEGFRFVEVWNSEE